MAVADQLAESGARIEFCNPHIPELNARNALFPLVAFNPETLAAADVLEVLHTMNVMSESDFDGEVL